jgi:hypothetical protein
MRSLTLPPGESAPVLSNDRKAAAAKVQVPVLGTPADLSSGGYARTNLPVTAKAMAVLKDRRNFSDTPLTPRSTGVSDLPSPPSSHQVRVAFGVRAGISPLRHIPSTRCEPSTVLPEKRIPECTPGSCASSELSCLRSIAGVRCDALSDYGIEGVREEAARAAVKSVDVFKVPASRR